MSRREGIKSGNWVLRFRRGRRVSSKSLPDPQPLDPHTAPRSSPALTSRSAGWGEAVLGSGSGSAGGSGAAGAEEEAPDAAQEPGTPECPRPAHSAPKR